MRQSNAEPLPLLVEVSGDRAVWHDAASFTPATDQYVHYAFDLDTALNNAEIAFDSSVFVRFTFQTSQFGDELYMDNVRLSIMDFFPPNVIQQSPETTNESLNTVMVTFDDPIDPATFSADDVTLVTPIGRVVRPTAVSSEDGFTWSIEFAEQSTLGTYRLSVGPNLADTSGNLMSQGAAAIDGQTFDRNAYESTIQLGSPTPQSLPIEESFESTIDSLAGWEFATTDAGIWRIDNSNAIAGELALTSGLVSSVPSENEATILVDFSGKQQDEKISLDLWVTREGHSSGNFGSIQVSGDSESWFTLYGLAPPLGEPTHYVFDLADALTVSYTHLTLPTTPYV